MKLGFLHRHHGDDAQESRPPANGGADLAADAQVVDEAARERALLRAEATRLDDPLLQRQMRYADRSWTPPAEGGSRRADDSEGRDER